MESKLTGILLAGGRGLRLGEHTHGSSKALVEIEGRELGHYAINFLKAVGAEEIIALCAHDFEKVTEHILSYCPEAKIIEGDLRGSLYSLYNAWPHISHSFLLCNADHIYKKPIAEKVKNQLQGVRAFCDFDRELGDDDMKAWHENGLLKKLSKKLEEFNGGYVGLTYCSKEKFNEYQKAIEQMLSTGRENLVVEDALRQLVENGENVGIGDISGHGWLEVDFPHELERAREIIKNNPSEFHF